MIILPNRAAPSLIGKRVFQLVGELSGLGFSQFGQKQRRQFDDVETGGLELFACARGVFGHRVAPQTPAARAL